MPLFLSETVQSKSRLLGKPFLKSLLIYLGGQKIKSKEDLVIYLRQALAKVSGKVVLDYSQKILGKKHYKWSTQDEYAKELVRCQIAVHRILCRDLMRLLPPDGARESESFGEAWREIFVGLHLDYVRSAPPHMKLESKPDFCELEPVPVDLKDLAEKAGEEIFKVLPFTQQLLQSNLPIFQGQIRLHYINFANELEAKLNGADLQSVLRPTQHSS